jgi:isoquinoline 1-oxidoreductase
MRTDPLTQELVEDERYELQQRPTYYFQANRRQFVQVLGAGLMIAAASSGPVTAQQRGRRGRGGRGGGREPLAQRLHIGTDGTVTVLTGKVEVGQGSRTQVIQAAAEELSLPIEQVKAVLGDTEMCPNDGGTSGSRTTPSTIPQVRAAAAAARELLAELAAEKLSVDRSALELRDGKFVHPASERGVTFADLTADESLAQQWRTTSSGDATLTRVERWSILGKPTGKVDGADVVRGVHQYPSDIRRPDMLYGKVLRPPAYGAELESVDTSVGEAIEGVVVVRDGDFVGCAGPTSWAADQALQRIAETARWSTPGNQPSSETLYQHLKRTADGGGGRRGDGPSDADIQAALDAAAKSHEASYEIAYIQHAPMEPRAAVAEWEDGKLTVWTATQNPLRVRGELMSVFRLEADQVRVIVPDSGGAFGGKHTGETAIEAARLAQATRRPVSLRWTREEEFTWAYFRPAGLIEVRAGLDEDGKLAAWEHTNYNSGGSAIETPYTVGVHREQSVRTDSPLRQGSYRALASTANVFARESSMDDLAAMAEIDPLAFRLAHLPQGRLRTVLETAAKRFEWDRRRAERQPGRGVGLACGIEKASYTAACVEVAIEDGRIKVLDICQAYECGAIHNPTNLRAQVEGCIVMGLGGALSEAIGFENGRITNPAFSSYAVPRMRDVPRIDVVLVNRPDLESVGAGETPIIAVAPAIANAVFHATGKRLRSMPLRGDLS